MAGIKVPQYEVFKIETSRMKHSNWNYTTTVREAREQNAYVALFESQLFRIISKILQTPIGEIKFREYVLLVVISNKAHFNVVTKPEGIIVNGKRFRRFVGTTNGLKMNTLVFVNVEIFDELYRRCECGRDPGHKLVPAKYEAYKSLTCSASQPICEPKGILVVSDALVKIREDIIEIDDSGDGEEPIVQFKENVELENNASDGFNLCTIGYMERVADSLMIDYIPSGVCLRNAWLKGMLYPFPIVEFAEKVAGGNYIVKDIWGNDKDLREVEMILTESSLKLWDCYSSIEDYLEKIKINGYEFAVTKIAPHELEDIREVNYQYLQSYDLTDDEIEELCKPTVDYLKGAMGGDYKTMCEFIGANEDSDSHSWQRGLYESDYLMDDPFVLDSINRYIRKKIDQAKIGKLIVHGNYQIASGDPYILMQHICGLKETGLLKAGQIHSDYWRERDVSEVAVFRSPMTSHNNIRRCEVVNTSEWYRYMKGIMILNAFDTMCQSLNGCD